MVISSTPSLPWPQCVCLCSLSLISYSYFPSNRRHRHHTIVPAATTTAAYSALVFTSSTIVCIVTVVLSTVPVILSTTALTLIYRHYDQLSLFCHLFHLSLLYSHPEHSCTVLRLWVYSSNSYKHYTLCEESINVAFSRYFVT